MILADGIHLIASGNLGVNLTHSHDCNAYALRCGDEYCLIDAGVGRDADRIAAQLTADGVDSARVTRLLLTHYHLDHAGGARFLHEKYGLAVMASALTAQAVERGDQEMISLAAAKRAGIYPQDFPFEACPIAETLEPGAVLEIGDTSIEVIAAPGHSRDLICFLARQPHRTVLFSGDSFFYNGRIVLQVTHDCSVPDYVQTLRNLAEYDFDMLFAGHGLWALEDGYRHIDAAMSYIKRLQLPPNLI